MLSGTSCALKMSDSLGGALTTELGSWLGDNQRDLSEGRGWHKINEIKQRTEKEKDNENYNACQGDWFPFTAMQCREITSLKYKIYKTHLNTSYGWKLQYKIRLSPL